MPEWQKLYTGDFAKGGQIYEIAHDGTSRVYARISKAAQGLAFAVDGTLYCAGGDAIWKITPTTDGSMATEENGHVTRWIEGLSSAKAVAIDHAGNVWFTEFKGAPIPAQDGQKEDYEPGALSKATPDGSREIVESGLVWPYGLACGPDGDIYLASLGAMSVFRYPVGGGSRELVANKITWLRNVTFHPNGDLFALGADGITRITTDGQRSMFHSHEKGKNKHPVGLAFDANGTLYSSDVRLEKNDKDAAGTIYVYDANGERRIFTKIGYSPFYLAFWPVQKPE